MELDNVREEGGISPACPGTELQQPCLSNVMWRRSFSSSSRGSGGWGRKALPQLLLVSAQRETERGG